jgi:hypothetical protein
MAVDRETVPFRPRSVARSATPSQAQAKTLPRQGSLSPAELLRLQRVAGNRAVERWIARQETATVDDDFEVDVEAEAAAQAAARAARVAQARAPLDEALSLRDATMFLTRLRTMPAADRTTLLDDVAFMAEMGRVFRGTTRLRVSTLLRFGERRPDYVIQLLTALDDRDGQRVADTLRGRPEVRDPAFLPGLREVVAANFAGSRWAVVLLRILTEPRIGARSGMSSGYAEAHYEIPPGQTTYQVERLDGRADFMLERTSSELRVTVSIGLREAGGFGHVTPQLISTWRSGIESNWNNRFRFTNGPVTLPVVFVPLFDRGGSGDHIVRVTPRPPASGRADQSDWHAIMDGTTAAHEFGHMLGNVDEYRLPAGPAQIPASLALSPAEAAASTQQGLEAAEQAATGHSVQWAPPVHGEPGRTSAGIMGDGTGAQGRNALVILRFFNASMRQSGEAEFHIQM